MPVIEIESNILSSAYLERDVIVDFYFDKNQLQDIGNAHLLLINDGQDLITMSFERILSDLLSTGEIAPMLCVGIHCGADRRNEYGTVGYPDYKGRGRKAAQYEDFIFKELFSLISGKFQQQRFRSVGFCGFSLGGLSALDISWRNTSLFHTIGIFSGSLWWRSVSQDDENFDESQHRIMHQKIKSGHYAEGLRFFFETGTLDETADRNGNGIIDSIDDTQALIRELEKKGYVRENDIAYLELKDGRHDVSTWARAFPVFLKWGFGSVN